MENKNNLTFSNFFMLWFGAAISIAEILTGGLVAPLGFKKGLLAIIIGHVMGTFILILGGIIGSRERVPSIISTEKSFGIYGTYLFSILNVLQLVGWTTVMIRSGASSVNVISQSIWNFNNVQVWSLIIGLLICLWIFFGSKGFKIVNSIAVALLLILTVVLSYVIFKDGHVVATKATGTMSFGSAIELSVVMPLSWLPLIADYTRFGRSEKEATIGSFLGYFLGSIWMFVIGLGSALISNSADPAQMMLAANLGFMAVSIMILSTVTTTFLDANSAGVTFVNLNSKIGERKASLIMCIIGIILAILIPMEQYENFLYAIGSVFAPLFAVVIADYFFIKKNGEKKTLLNIGSLVVWIVGVILYYIFIKYDFLLGATVPDMIVTGSIYVFSWRWIGNWKFMKKSQSAC